MSKLNVGVGADFPVDSAEPGDDDRYEGCDYARFRRHRHRFGRHRGRFFFFGPLALIVFIAMISMAISYPMVILGLVAIAAVAFAARHHHHDWYDHDDYDLRDRDGYGRRDRGYDPRDRTDVGPQPDAPDNAAPGRS
ncbi:MAG: hypothetical protein GC190_19670 [Alphaproteobacteria bacterium]|nr:hypothetical protein [Alphaproteobacteria bacterium]